MPDETLTPLQVRALYCVLMNHPWREVRGEEGEHHLVVVRCRTWPQLPPIAVEIDGRDHVAVVSDPDRWEQDLARS